MSNFELLSELGTGGMGTVWKARNTATGEIVALKLLHPHLARDREYLQRFEREVEVTQRIDSPHVVKVLGHGMQDGIPFMAMEFVDGISLRDRIREEGMMPWLGSGGAKELVLQISEGLEAAHRAGVIHRDVKPSNVLITAEGTAKLADFGISRALDMTRFTNSGTTMGTPAYMSPDRDASPQSDFYSLGCVLFEMLVGAPPFEGESQQALLVAHMRDKPNLSRAPAETRPLLATLLAKSPSDRPQDAAMLRTLIRREPNWLTTTRVAAIAAAVLLGVSGSAGAFWLSRGGSAATGTAIDPTPTRGFSVAVSYTPTPAAATASSVSATPTPPPASSTAAPPTPVTPTPSTPQASDASATPTSTALPTPTPTSTASQTAVFAFVPGGGAYPAPSEIDICWKASPPGARFFVTISQTAPREGNEWSSEYIASAATSCRFVPTVAGDVPSVSYHAIARNDGGAIVAETTYTFPTYLNPGATNSPEILSLDVPTSAHLGDQVVFRVRWRDSDGDAVTVTLRVEGAVLSGTETPFADSRDVSTLAVTDQQAGHESAFGVICDSVDPQPRNLSVTVVDAAGHTATRTSSFACVA